MQRWRHFTSIATSSDGGKNNSFKWRLVGETIFSMFKWNAVLWFRLMPLAPYTGGFLVYHAENQKQMNMYGNRSIYSRDAKPGTSLVNCQAPQVIMVRSCLPSWYAAENYAVQRTIDGSRRTGKSGKSWKDHIKKWTGQLLSSFLRIADDRSRWATITPEASVGVRFKGRQTKLQLPQLDTNLCCDFSCCLRASDLREVSVVATVPAHLK